MRYLILLLAVAIFSCGNTEEHGHEHEGEEANDHSTEGQPSVDTTIWTDNLELFVEFPALVAGKASRFAAHLTVLENHQPIREGQLTVSLIKDGRGIRQTVEKPSSPGIFNPALQPKEAGVYELVFELKAPGIMESIGIKNIRVYSSVEEAQQANPAKEEDNISFLKEQAWKMDFQTIPAKMSEIYEVVPTSGIWKVAPSDHQALIANTRGTVRFSMENLTEGRPVKKGQELLTISSSALTTGNLGAEIQKARAELDQARAEYNRKKELYESKIVPKAELEKVEQRYNIARTTYNTLASGYSPSGKKIVAPYDGYLKSLTVTNGAFVEEGANLLTITSHNSSILQTWVGISYASKLDDLKNIFYMTSEGRWSNINDSGGQITSIGKEIEPESPQVSIFAEVNDTVNMPEGSFTEVQLAFGTPEEAVVVPDAALLEDYGSYSVIIQLSGETFERRPVKTGRRNGELVEIINGVKPGEMVVTKGAYQVKMASMSGQAPAHGHAH